MPKNKGKGGKGHKKGKSEGQASTRELLFKEESQEYALVNGKLGGCNMELIGSDGVKRIGHVRGNMRKKVWITPGDLVLISLRDFEDGKADIVHRYTPDEYRMLKSYGELSDDMIGKNAEDKMDIPPDTEEVEVDFSIDDI